MRIFFLGLAVTAALATDAFGVLDVPMPHVARWHLGAPWLPPIINSPQPACQITSPGAAGNPSVGWNRGWTTVTMSNTTTDPAKPPNPRFNPDTWITSATMTSTCGQPLPPALPLPLPYTYNYYPTASSCTYNGTVDGPGGIGTCSLTVLTAPPLCSLTGGGNYGTDCGFYYSGAKSTSPLTTLGITLDYSGGGPWTSVVIPKVFSLTNPPGGLPQTITVSIAQYTATIFGTPGLSTNCSSSVIGMSCVCVSQPKSSWCDDMPGKNGAPQVAFNDPHHGCIGMGGILRGFETPNFNPPQCDWTENCQVWKGKKIGWWTYWVGIAARGCNPGCFAPDVRITLFGGGSKRASEITGADLLWNPVLRQPMHLRRIIRGPEKYRLIEIGFGGKVIQVTRKHPMMTPQGVRAAETITTRDSILGTDLQYHPVEIVHRLPFRKDMIVYNFEIATESTDPSDHALEANGIVTGDYYLQVLLETGHPPRTVAKGRGGLD